jgi:chromosome segregation ATPase
LVLKIRQLRSAFESLAKKLAEEKLKRSNLEHVVDDMNLMLRQKSLDLDNVTKNWLKEKNECDVIKNELTACRQRLSESKESTKMANKKQIECEEGAISLTLRLEQMDAALNEKSAELEFTRDKYKRKVEKLRDCERKNNMLAEELEKITKMGEEQKQHYSQLVEKLNNDFNTLQKNMLLSEQSLKTELDNLRNSIIDKDKNHLKEIDFLESHCRDATEKFRLLQTVEAEMDRLKRQNEKLTSKRDRAEHHVQILVQELEQESKST